jgi:hypothetical protein
MRSNHHPFKSTQNVRPLLIGVVLQGVLLLGNGLGQTANAAPLTKPVGIKLSRQGASSGEVHFLLSWKRVAGATFYRVFKSTSNASFPTKPFAVTGRTSLEVARPPRGQKHFFIVKAVRGRRESSASSVVSLFTASVPTGQAAGSPAGDTGLAARIAAPANPVESSPTPIQAPLQPATGFYRLVTRGEKGMAVDVLGYGNFNEAKVIGFPPGQTSNQRWMVERQADGSYKIRAYSGQNSRMVLEVFGGNPQPGKAASLYEDNNTIAQRWYFVHVGEDCFRIIPKDSPPNVDLTLQVRAGKNGETLEIALFDGSDHQLFRLEDFGAIKLRSSNYRIMPRNHPEISLGVKKTARGLMIGMEPTGNVQSQRWRFDQRDDGGYTISIQDNQALDITDGAPFNRMPVRIWQNNNSPAQTWILEEVTGGYFRIVPKSGVLDSDQTLQVVGELNGASGGGLEIFPYGGTDNQVFQLEDLDAFKKK